LVRYSVEHGCWPWIAKTTLAQFYRGVAVPAKKRKKWKRIRKLANLGAACASTHTVRLHYSHSKLIHSAYTPAQHRLIALPCPSYPELSEGSSEQDCIQGNLSSRIDPSPTGTLTNFVHERSKTVQTGITTTGSLLAYHSMVTAPALGHRNRSPVPFSMFTTHADKVVS
jgi:hypothetical protein